MLVFSITLVIVFVFSVLARVLGETTKESIYTKPNILFVLLVLSSLVLVSGLRANTVGDDTWAYKYAFNKLDKQIRYSDLDILNSDFGFIIYQKLIKYFTVDPQVFLFVTALITNLLIIVVLYKYSLALELSVFTYITSGWYFTSMNGVRQFLAASIIFIGTKYILNGNWRKYFIIVLVAASIHKSALILLPLYFLVRKRAWSGTYFLILFISILVLVGFNQFSTLLFSLLEGTQYGHYSTFSEGGANILRAAIIVPPLIIAYKGRRKLREINPGIDYIVNLSLISFLFMLIASQNWIFARLNIYFGLYNSLLISWIITLFKGKSGRLVYYLIVLMYYIYFVYEMRNFIYSSIL